MRNIDFRTLRADEIEVRPSHVKDGKANLLLYIDSRAVVSLLNETVGNLNWQSKFKGQLIKMILKRTLEINSNVLFAEMVYQWNWWRHRNERLSKQ